MRASWQEGEAGDELDRLNAGIGNLPQPVGVLIARETLTAAEVPRTYPVAEHNAAWLASSRRLAGLSADSTVTTLDGCDHMIQLRQPEVVVREILTMLERSRSTSSGGANARPGR